MNKIILLEKLIKEYRQLLKESSGAPLKKGDIVWYKIKKSEGVFAAVVVSEYREITERYVEIATVDHPNKVEVHPNDCENIINNETLLKKSADGGMINKLYSLLRDKYHIEMNPIYRQKLSKIK